MINRVEYLRLLAQSLQSLGFSDIAARLEAESVSTADVSCALCVLVSSEPYLRQGVLMQSPQVSKFQGGKLCSPLTVCSPFDDPCSWIDRELPQR